MAAEQSPPAAGSAAVWACPIAAGWGRLADPATSQLATGPAPPEPMTGLVVLQRGTGPEGWGWATDPAPLLQLAMDPARWELVTAPASLLTLAIGPGGWGWAIDPALLLNLVSAPARWGLVTAPAPLSELVTDPAPLMLATGPVVSQLGIGFGRQRWATVMRVPATDPAGWVLATGLGEWG